MTSHESSWPLTLCLTASLLLHLVGLPLVIWQVRAEVGAAQPARADDPALAAEHSIKHRPAGVALHPAARPAVSLTQKTTPDLPPPPPEGAPPSQDVQVVQPRETPDKPEVSLGREDALPLVSVAWISHDDFQKLVARRSKALQPAVQRESTHAQGMQVQTSGDSQAKPAAKAPAENAQPPEVQSAQAQPPQVIPPPAVAQPANPGEEKVSGEEKVGEEKVPGEEKVSGTVFAVQRAEESPAALKMVPDTFSSPPISSAASASAETDPARAPAAASRPHEDKSSDDPLAPTERAPVSAAASQPKRVEPKPHPPVAAASPAPGEGQAGNAGNPGNPGLAGARSDRESMAASPFDVKDMKVQPGRVVVGRGVEIKTAVPQLSVIAQLSASPNNPRVRMVFDATGQVVEAQFLEGTGSGNWDGPILASLYRWRAAGERLKDYPKGFTLELTILLRE